MKVFHFIDSFQIGGSEGQLLQLALHQARSGDQITLGCIQLKSQLHELPLELQSAVQAFPISGGAFSRRGGLAILRLAAYLRKRRFDVVHTHDLYSNLVGVPAAFLARTPRIISSRRDLGSWWWYTPRNRTILRWIQNLSHIVLANSEAVRRFLVEEDGFSPDRVVVIRNAVDTERFSNALSNRDVLPEVTKDRFVVAMVANMHTHTKGHVVVLRALRELVEAHPEILIVFVGDGQLRPQLEEIARTLGLQKHTRFLGARTDVPRILSACDAGLLASQAEGLPNSLLEYMAAGKLAICSAVGGILEVIRHGENGLLFAPDSPDALREVLDLAISDKQGAESLAAKGRELMLTDFTFERLRRETAQLYLR